MMDFKSFKSRISQQIKEHKALINRLEEEEEAKERKRKREQEAQALEAQGKAKKPKKKSKKAKPRKLFSWPLPTVWVERCFHGASDALCFAFSARFSQMPHFKRFVETRVDLDSLAKTLGLLYLQELFHGCDIFPERKIACQTPHGFKVEQRAQFNTLLVSEGYLSGIKSESAQWQIRNLQRSVSGAFTSNKLLSPIIQGLDEIMRDAFNRFERKMGTGMSHHWDTSKKRAECAREILEWRIELEIPVKDHVRFGWGPENIRKLIEDQTQP